MSNLSSKMPASPFSIYRTFASALLWGSLIAVPTRAQQLSEAPRVTWPATEGLRSGDMAPQFRLPDARGKTFDSRDLLGQKPLFCLVDGPTPLLTQDKLDEAAQKAAARGIALALIAPNPQIGQTYSWAAPFTTLRAPDGSFKNVTSPAFLAIDRAGWLRDMESLPSSLSDTENVRLQFVLSQTPDPTPPLEVGKIAPDFSFRDANGNWHRVSALRGRKNLLLTFFPKCFTGKCRTHLSSLRDQYLGFMAAQTEIWAVSVDAAQGDNGQLAFSRELGLPFPLLPDEGRNICLLYGATATPLDVATRQSVLIDKNGIVRWITQNVNPTTHGEDVLAKITELGLLKTQA